MEEREELKIEDLKNSASSRHMRSQSPAGIFQSKLPSKFLKVWIMARNELPKVIRNQEKPQSKYDVIVQHGTPFFAVRYLAPTFSGTIVQIPIRLRLTNSSNMTQKGSS